MNVLNSWQTKLAIFALAAASMTACAVDDGGASAPDDNDSVGETSQAISGRYCVDQNTASVGSYEQDQLFLTCQAQPVWRSTISRGHPVNVHDDCGTYVRVKDLWGTSSWVMRKDALTPC